MNSQALSSHIARAAERLYLMSLRQSKPQARYSRYNAIRSHHHTAIPVSAAATIRQPSRSKGTREV